MPPAIGGPWSARSRGQSHAAQIQDAGIDAVEQPRTDFDLTASQSVVDVDGGYGDTLELVVDVVVQFL